MLYRDTDGRIRQKGISKDVDDFYAYDGSEEYEEEYDDINDRADYEYEKMMDDSKEIKEVSEIKSLIANGCNDKVAISNKAVNILKNDKDSKEL